MQVKKFTGENTAIVMANIRREFGDDAIILQTNKIKTGGFLGFFQKEEVEILAALDNETKNIKNKKQKQYSGKNDFKSHMDNLNEIANMKRKDDLIESSMSNSSNNKNSYISKTSFEKEQMEVRQDIDEIKNTVRQLSQKINETFKTTKEEEEIKRIQESIEKLKSLGISYEISKEIVTNLQRSGKIDTYENLKSEIFDIFSNYIKVDNTPNVKNIIFIGSTGVGKTTSLAKIASKEAIEKKKKIGFLTLDTYRISAVEQLKTYAEILSSPIEVAYEITDLNLAIERLSNRDLVFIDTAGRSHNNSEQVEDLKKVLDTIQDKKIYLVLSANMSIEDMYDIIDIYSFVKDYDIIVTKMDETKRQGNLLNIMKKTQKSIAYIAFGQNVPDDIEKFDLKTYISKLIKEMHK